MLSVATKHYPSHQAHLDRIFFLISIVVCSAGQCTLDGVVLIARCLGLCPCRACLNAEEYWAENTDFRCNINLARGNGEYSAN